MSRLTVNLGDEALRAVRVAADHLAHGNLAASADLGEALRIEHVLHLQAAKFCASRSRAEVGWGGAHHDKAVSVQQVGRALRVARRRRVDDLEVLDAGAARQLDGLVALSGTRSLHAIRLSAEGRRGRRRRARTASQAAGGRPLGGPAPS